MQKASVIIGNPHGLHVRPSTELISIARSYKSKLHLEVRGACVTLDSPINLLANRIQFGDSVDVVAEGEDEQAALDAVCAFLRSNKDFRSQENN